MASNSESAKKKLEVLYYWKDVTYFAFDDGRELYINWLYGDQILKLIFLSQDVIRSTTLSRHLLLPEAGYPDRLPPGSKLNNNSKEQNSTALYLIGMKMDVHEKKHFGERPPWRGGGGGLVSEAAGGLLLDEPLDPLHHPPLQGRGRAHGEGRIRHQHGLADREEQQKQ